MAPSVNHNRRRRTFPRRPLRERRGSAIIMVLLVLVLLLIMGLAYINSARSDRVAAASAANRNLGDAAVQATVDHIGRIIADDWLDFAEKLAAGGAADEQTIKDLTGMFRTHPDRYHPWLASSAPDVIDGVAPTWGQLSLLGQSFIRLDQLGQASPTLDKKNGHDPPDPAESTREPIRFPASPAANATLQQQNDNIWARTSPNPDDPYDAKWQLLPYADAEGIRWVIGVRIVDNGGMINVNTATQITNDPRVTGVTRGAWGRTPADIDLHGLLAKADQMEGQAASLRDQVKAAWEATTPWGLMKARGLDPTTHPLYTPAGRDEAWLRIGSRLDLLLTRGAPAGEVYFAFGASDEARLLAYRLGALDEPQSELDVALVGRGQRLPRPVTRVEDGVERSYIEVNSVRVRDPHDLRPILTTVNGTRQIMGNGRFRAPTVPWADAADGTLGGGPVPGFRLSPNTEPPQALAAAFFELLKFTGPPGGAQVGYEGSNYKWLPADPSGTPVTPPTQFSRAADAAASLAANIAAYRSTEEHYQQAVANAVDNPLDTSVRHYGLEKMPFLAEATLVVERKDVNDDSVIDGTSAGERPSDATHMAVVELRNPWPDRPEYAVDLNEFQLRIGNQTIDLATGTGTKTLPGGGAVLVYTHNDAKFVEFIDSVRSATPKYGNRVGNVPEVLYCPTSFASFGGNNATVQVLAKTSTGTPIVVDRMGYDHRPGDGRTTSAWPPEPAAGDEGGDAIAVPAAGGRAITFASLQRDSRPNRFFPAMTLNRPGGGTDALADRGGGAPNFVYEDPRNNLVLDGNHDFGNLPSGAERGTADNPIKVDGAEKFEDVLRYSLGTMDKHPDGRMSVQPPPIQLPVKNAPLDAIGEVASLYTISHTDQATFSELLGRRWRERLEEFRKRNYQAPSGAAAEGEWYLYAARLRGAGMLRYNDMPESDNTIRAEQQESYFRNVWPYIPAAVSIFEVLDLLPEMTPTAAPVVHGRLNVNTAPAKAMQALPYLSEFDIDIAERWDPAQMLVHYRDNLLYPMGGGGPETRAKWTGIFELRKPLGTLEAENSRGFVGIGELLLVQNEDPTLASAAGTGSTSAGRTFGRGIGIAARDLADTQDFITSGQQYPSVASGGGVGPEQLKFACGPADPTPEPANVDFAAVDDMEERALLFSAMSNLVDLRSDTFTAYVVLRGMREDPLEPVNSPTRWKPVVERRFAVVFDRTNVARRGDRPRVVTMIERN